MNSLSDDYHPDMFNHVTQHLYNLDKLINIDFFILKEFYQMDQPEFQLNRVNSSDTKYHLFRFSVLLFDMVSQHTVSVDSSSLLHYHIKP